MILLKETHGHPVSFKQAFDEKQEIVWQSLASISVQDATGEWLSTIQNLCTRKSYSTSMKELIDHGFLDAQWSLQALSLMSADAIIDRIKTDPLFIGLKGRPVKEWSIRTREARISCFLAFTRYLSRKTEGLIRKGIPCKDGINKTFSSRSRKIKTAAMTRSQLVRFFEELDKINPRDAMIARLCLHGAKRISEVLSLMTDQIDYENRIIKFQQAKSRLADDFTIISFERSAAYALLQKLKEYIGNRDGLVFVTVKNRGLQKNQVDRSFAKAGLRAEIPFRVSPHNLRATAVTLWKEDGFSDSLIMHATGHSSSEMVHRYDKSDIADNVTKKSCLLI